MSQHLESSPPVYAERNYLNTPATGVKSWLTTLDHKRIGVMFLVAALIFFAVGGLFAMLIRIELLTPGPTVMDAMTYNRMFTLHGVVMIFLFMIPAIPSGFGNFLLPIMVGAKDVAFPRLNLLSFYVYLLGAVIALVGMIYGGADTGWTFYTPYSTTTATKVVPILLGAFILGFSSILTGLNFIVTVHTLRAPGITWNKLPLFVWSIYGTSIIQILATPVLGMTLLLVAIEHAFGWGIFDPARGGDPVLFQHFFWFYSHPAVYIMVLPAMAVVSEVVCAFSRKNIFGYKAVAYSSLGIAFVGFFTWGHHLFTSGQSAFNAGIFGVLTHGGGHLHRHQGLQLGGHHVQGVDRLQDPLRLLHRLPLLPLLRRHDRRGPGHGLARHPLAGHLLRGGPLPLHHGGVDHHGLPGRAPLLVAQDHRPHVQRALGAGGRHPGDQRLRLHLPAAVPARQRGDAAPLLQLPGAVPGAQRGLHRRGLGAGHRVPDHPGLHPGVAEARRHRRRPTRGARGATSG